MGLNMYRVPAKCRVLAILSVGSILAACSSSSMNLDAFKPAPLMETLRFESEPSGAEAKTSTGQTCRTPCALAVPAGNGLSVTFTLNGYKPETETIELVSMGDGTSNLRPNPVLVELSPGAPPKKMAPAPAPAKKKPARKPKPASPAAPAAAPAAMAPGPGSTAASPWPSPAR
jgi:hypothetical protein